MTIPFDHSQNYKKLCRKPWTNGYFCAWQQDKWVCTTEYEHRRM